MLSFRQFHPADFPQVFWRNHKNNYMTSNTKTSQKDASQHPHYDPERPLAVKIPRAAEALGISKSSVRRLIAQNEIRAITVLRHTMVPVSELERFCSK